MQLCGLHDDTRNVSELRPKRGITTPVNTSSASIRERLIDCFTVVFPSLITRRSEVVAANIDNTEDWDSANHFVLIEVIEETFGFRLSDSIAGECISFDCFEVQVLRNVRSS